jgi:hypothetical protein
VGLRCCVWGVESGQTGAGDGSQPAACRAGAEAAAAGGWKAMAAAAMPAAARAAFVKAGRSRGTNGMCASRAISHLAALWSEALAGGL